MIKALIRAITQERDLVMDPCAGSFIVLEVCQELGLTTQSCAKLEKATSYQELSSLQKQAFQEKLESEIADKNSATYLNWALGILTLGSLVALAWMIFRQNKGVLPESNKGEK